MSATNDFFGWDLLHRTIESKINRESDIIIALVHWFLTRNAAFRCIGIGEDKTLSDSDKDNASELLPEGWNANGDNYALRYLSNNTLYMLLAVNTEDTLVVNLLDVNSRNVSNLALSPTETVKSLNGSLRTMVPGVSELMERFKRELTEPVFSGTTKEDSTQTSQTTQSESTSRLRDPTTAYPRIHPSPLYEPFGGLSSVGRGDLDILGRGGGGMLFPSPGDPGSAFRGPGIGPFGIGGPHVPRPRFDPFGPVDPNGRRNPNYPNPNPDHFRPPSEFDDMFS